MNIRPPAERKYKLATGTRPYTLIFWSGFFLGFFVRGNFVRVGLGFSVRSYFVRGYFFFLFRPEIFSPWSDFATNNCELEDLRDYFVFNSECDFDLDRLFFHLEKEQKQKFYKKFCKRRSKFVNFVLNMLNMRLYCGKVVLIIETFKDLFAC